MKKIFIPIAIACLASGTIFTGCESSSQKYADATQDVTDAQVKLIKAKAEADADYEKSKAEWAAQIEKNDKALADYKAGIAKEKEEKRKTDNEKLADLEKRNDDLKAKLNGYQPDTTKWEDFKTSFNKGAQDFDNDMTAFGNCLSAIWKNDTK